MSRYTAIIFFFLLTSPCAASALTLPIRDGSSRNITAADSFTASIFTDGSAGSFSFRLFSTVDPFTGFYKVGTKRQYPQRTWTYLDVASCDGGWIHQSSKTGGSGGFQTLFSSNYHGMDASCHLVTLSWDKSVGRANYQIAVGAEWKNLAVPLPGSLFLLAPCVFALIGATGFRRLS